MSARIYIYGRNRVVVPGVFSIAATMLTQEALLFILAISTGVIALINNLIKEGSFIRSSKRTNAGAVKFVEQLSHLSDDSRDKFRNALFFESETGRRAPIYVINLILNCYDPHIATYIYSKAPRYISFRKDSIENWQIQEPSIVRGRLLPFTLWLMMMNAWALLILSLYALGVVLVSAVINASVVESAVVFRVSIAVFLLFVVLAIALLRYAYKEMAFLELVKKFYEDKPNAQRTLIRSEFRGPLAKVR